MGVSLGISSLGSLLRFVHWLGSPGGMRCSRFQMRVLKRITPRTDHYLDHLDPFWPIWKSLA